jgi:hypothetical protein
MVSNKTHTSLISALSVVLLFAGTALAKTKQIDVVFPATVGKMLKLKPGNYRIDVVNNSKSPAVKFYNQDGKLMGQAPVKLVNEAQKNNQTQIDYFKVASNDRVITEISPGGWRENLLFSKAKTRRSTSSK